MTDQRAQLAALTEGLVAAFNAHDIDAVMAFFADDAVFEGLRGERGAGAAEIRAAFAPLLSGAVGRIRFDEVDTFIDPEAAKVMTAWTLTLEKDGAARRLSGLDLLHFRGGKIVRKLSYAKAETPLYAAV